VVEVCTPCTPNPRSIARTNSNAKFESSVMRVQSTNRLSFNLAKVRQLEFAWSNGEICDGWPSLLIFRQPPSRPSPLPSWPKKCPALLIRQLKSRLPGTVLALFKPSPTPQPAIHDILPAYPHLSSQPDELARVGSTTEGLTFHPPRTVRRRLHVETGFKSCCLTRHAAEHAPSSI
jgi:hypothetical protein